MSSGKNRTKNARVTLAKQLIAGTAKHFANVSTLPLASGPVTPAQVTTSLQTIVTLRTDVDSAKAQATAKVLAEKTQMPALVVVMDDLESYVRALFGRSPEVLADFGLAPKKANRPLTSDEKSAAAAKRKATRAARHTMGSVERRKVKGNVVDVAVVPVTSAEPAAAQSPAAGASSGANGGAAPRA